MRVLLVACGLLAGCAQVLGLDDTTLVADAPTDAGGVCDADPPRCTSTTGRTVCGQVFLAGGAPLRVAAPTGEVCAPGSLEGPCALQILGLPSQGFFDGVGMGDVPGTIDDCGRFVVPDLDAAISDVAIKLTGGAAFQPSARLVLARPAGPGEDRGIAAFAIEQATLASWATQLSVTTDVISSGYLVRYTSAADTPVAGEAVAVDSGSPLTSPPGTVPWAAYFGAEPFGSLDPAATTTGASGTAFAGMPVGPFSLEGFRPGKRCKIENLRSVGNVLIHVVEQGC